MIIEWSRERVQCARAFYVPRRRRDSAYYYDASERARVSGSGSGAPSLPSSPEDTKKSCMRLGHAQMRARASAG